MVHVLDQSLNEQRVGVRADSRKTSLTGVEQYLDVDEIIVSKTDPRGVITYANDVFIDISGYTEYELMGKPHSIIRHPHMPRCVFKLLWETIVAGDEIFAYVVNRCKNGDHYWVFAHVTPSYDENCQLIGYHSSRRAPRREAVNAVVPLYKHLCQIEAEVGGNAGMEKAFNTLLVLLKDKGVRYEEFVLAL